jgi:hypothetical protein
MKTESIISLLLAVVGTVLFTALLGYHLIGQAAFVTLMSILALVCIVVLVLRRLTQLDLKNMKITLEKFEKVRDDVFAKEKDIAKMSLLVSQLFAFNSAFEGRIYQPESHRLQQEWYYRKTAELLAAIKASPLSTEEVLKYFHAMRRYETSDNAAQKLEWHNLMNMIREDIGKKKTTEETNDSGCSGIGMVPL